MKPIFFAGFVVAGVVADRKFLDLVAQVRQLGGDLGLEAEPLLLDFHLCEYLTSEDFVAGFHVGEFLTGNRVRGSRQSPVAEAMQP